MIASHVYKMIYECAAMAGNSHACDSFKSILSIMAVLSTWTTKNSLYMKMQHFKVMTLVRALLYLSTKTRGDWVRGLASRQQRNK